MRPVGFTLIELLVVIDSVALLLLLVMPSLGKINDLVAMKFHAGESNEEIPRLTFQYNYNMAGDDAANQFKLACLPIRNPASRANLIHATLNQRLAGICYHTLCPYLKRFYVYNGPQDFFVEKSDGGGRAYSLMKQHCMGAWLRCG